MGTFRYESQSSGSLVDRLSLPIAQISIGFAQHGRPISVTLWHSDGTGLRITSVMHDIAERLELGVLSFDDAEEMRPSDAVVDAPASFSSVIIPNKLVIEESGSTAESGVVLKGSDGNEIVVLAGAYPYSLAISGIAPMPHSFEPEYPLNSYTRADLQEQ